MAIKTVVQNSALEESAERAFNDLKKKVSLMEEQQQKAVRELYYCLYGDRFWFETDSNYANPSSLDCLRLIATAYSHITGNSTDVVVKGSEVTLHYEK